MRGAAKKAAVEGASEELERRSQYLSSLIHRTKVKSEADQKEDVEDKQEEEKKGIKDGDGFDGDPPQEQRQPPNVKVRASDMPLALQKRAFKCARETLASMPRLESKRLACALKKARFFPLYFLFNYLM
ncbi:Dynein light chain type 1 [Musa troglodytarum]|uniref:Dynein light chain type 1 n=1 Tax=Musa troglodytarum TaxID=320322 RepID=A0A9E7GQW7_9LILI|nr:Dynein light chain type 1 [Musa troglodytarum]